MSSVAHLFKSLPYMITKFIFSFKNRHTINIADFDKFHMSPPMKKSRFWRFYANFFLIYIFILTPHLRPNLLSIFFIIFFLNETIKKKKNTKFTKNAEGFIKKTVILSQDHKKQPVKIFDKKYGLKFNDRTF